MLAARRCPFCAAHPHLETSEPGSLRHISEPVASVLVVPISTPGRYSRNRVLGLLEFVNVEDAFDEMEKNVAVRLASHVSLMYEEDRIIRWVPAPSQVGGLFPTGQHPGWVPQEGEFIATSPRHQAPSRVDRVACAPRELLAC